MNTTNSFKKLLIDNKIERYNSRSTSIANYNSYSYFNNILHISGQLPIINGKLNYEGKIGRDLAKTESEESIIISTSNILWVVNDFLESEKNNYTDVRCLNLKGYLNVVEKFTEHSKLMDIASNLIIQTLGDKKGKHSRLAIGCHTLPKNSPVEIEAIFSIL